MCIEGGDKGLNRVKVFFSLMLHVMPNFSTLTYDKKIVLSATSKAVEAADSTLVHIEKCVVKKKSNKPYNKSHFHTE